ncbi:uncharacterized protein LOC127715169 [Mytilus californianus]|uniref:uncharacterized protein LOC127715169 n=1 Tax=Mytilus californianus TaxID=6549 RepID=UPI0022470955|nr:uncharacterized protein LOC127715169 [Mytilus californianus]
MESVAKFLNAAIVLPFTAGDASENQINSDYIRPHDGSISGVILISSVLVIVFLAMFRIRLVDSKVNKTIPYLTLRSYLCVTIVLAIVVFISHFIIYRVKRVKLITLPLTCFLKVGAITKLKLGFLWIFTFGGFVYALIKVIRVPCKANTLKDYKSVGCIDKNFTYYKDYEEANITFHCLQISFYFIQSCFIHFFIRSCFRSSWKIYYSFVFIVLANISQWAHYFADIYKDSNTRGYKLFCPMSNYSIENCYWETILKEIEPYLRPVQMEYFLLSMVLIAELWPSKKTYSNEINLIEADIANEYTPFESSTRGLLKKPMCLSSRVRTCMFVTLVVLFFLPCYIFSYLALLKSEKKDKYVNVTMKNVNVFYDIFISLIEKMLLIMNFYMISQSSYLRPVKRKEGFHFHHNMLIASFLGSIGYLSLVMISCIHAGQEHLLIAQKFLTMIKLYFQVVCILQLHNYEKCQRGVGEYIYLALSILNLCSWIDGSIFGGISIYDEEILKVVYDITTQRLITNVLFPFLIFFRFESFIIYYGIFRQTSVKDTLLKSPDHLLFDEL